MAYTALYREWRPKKFEDVVGQKHITVTLKNAIKNERIAHAYLFCGTRGTGKTSTAKIFAKAVNCLDLQNGEPCNKCDMCNKINSGLLMDVIELDAASNNGVDKIRDIIDSVKYPPSEARYKVYILDEVHMLSLGAVNAFLKTLEEPPSRVIFILATTDPQKLPITILSRCQRYDFKRIKNNDIFNSLRIIAKDQGVFADDNSLNLIARMSDGAMRDALSILDQAISMGGGNIKYDEVINMLGLVTNESLLKLTECIIEANVEKSMQIIDEVVFSGKDTYGFIRDMVTHMRNLLMVKISHNPEEVLDMSLDNIELMKEQAQKIRSEYIMRNIRILQEAEEQSRWVKQSRIYLELAALKMCKVEYDTSNETILARLNKLEEAMRTGEIKVACETIIPRVAKTQTSIKQEVRVQPIAQFNADSKLTLDIVKKNWRDILENFKARRQMILYACLATATVEDCKDGLITLMYNKDYAFNKQRLEKEDIKKSVEEVISEVLKERILIKVKLEVAEKAEKSIEEKLIEDYGDFVEILDE